MQAEKKNPVPTSVEANRALIDYDNYNEYLDSLISATDVRNLGSIDCARVVAGLGYRTHGETFSEEEFFKRRAVIYAAVYPKPKTHVLASQGIFLKDPLNRELASREMSNRLGIISSIIFVRNVSKSGFEISGYIDYAQRLLTDNWRLHFKHDKVLYPRDGDLGYHHWRHGTVRSSITRNYIPLMDPKRGLVFQNRHDHKLIYPDPGYTPGENTIKHRISSPNYLQVEIYDHIIRKKC